VKHSAGILLYRRADAGAEVLLVHPGGPLWAKKDEHIWSMPKGEFPADEDPLAAARREFTEETGFAPEGPPVNLGKQKTKGKVIHAWAVEGDWNPAALRSNTFTMEWPPRSGTMRTFPEVDRAGWFDLATARRKIHQGQVAFLDALEALLAEGPEYPLSLKRETGFIVRRACQHRNRARRRAARRKPRG
jgi:predicted NUDIX family NTP pyrophosphohydrolase